MKTIQSRLFFAIPLNKQYTDLIIKYIQSYPQLKQLRWTREENLHITLFFGGNINAEYIPDLIKAAEEIFNETSKFELAPESIILKPSQKTPLMIWLKFKKDYLFSSIHTQLKEVVKTLVKSTEAKTPIPHITLARIKNKIPVLLNQAEKLPKFMVDKVELWESIIDSRGAIYFNLKTFMLKD